MRSVPPLLSLLLALRAAADDAALAREIADYLELPEVQVTATRVARDPFDTPRAVTVVGPEEYARRRPYVAVDALAEHPGLWVEKRTSTTSDPVMRGFSGSNLLALVDGNTLTTLWGEGGFAGDDMYGKVDAYLVERVEVVRGPASVLYGSNTLGGVINFLTRSSRFDYTKGGLAHGATVYADFSSVDVGVRGRVEHHGATEAWRWLAGFTGLHNEDVRGGGDVGLQEPTSGEGVHFDARVQRRLGRDAELEAFLHRTDLEHTHRFYRPTQDNFNDRVAAGVVYRRERIADWLDRLEARVYHQHKRDTRRFHNNNRRGWTKTDTYVAAVQASTRPGTHRFTYGASFERDFGESPDDEQFTTHTAGMTDYVKDAPDSIWSDFGVYVQHEWEASRRFSLVSAARADFMHFKTKVDAFYDPPGPLDPSDDAYSDDIASVTGGVGGVFRWSESVHLVGGVSRGFRQFAPAFGARQQAAGILMPNRLLDPVTAIAYEAGVKVRRPAWWVDAFVYRTELYDFQNQRFGTFQGQDFFDFDGDGTFDPEERVLLNVPDGRAYVTGVEIEGLLKLHDVLPSVPQGFALRGGFAWNYGNDRTRDEPLRHVHPAHAIAALRYDDPDGRFWVEFGATMVRRADRIPSDRVASDPGFRSDPQDVTSPLVRADGSLPGYTVFDLRAGTKLGERGRLTLGLENLSDKKYRRLHSRMDAAGFGIRIGISFDF